jgi:hypothetical protein
VRRLGRVTVGFFPSWPEPLRSSSTKDWLASAGFTAAGDGAALASAPRITAAVEKFFNIGTAPAQLNSNGQFFNSDRRGGWGSRPRERPRFRARNNRTLTEIRETGAIEVAQMRVLAVVSIILFIGVASGVARAYWEEYRGMRRR